jgi:hypothetical protein
MYVGLEPRASRLLDSTQPVPLPTGNTKLYKLSQYLLEFGVIPYVQLYL